MAFCFRITGLMSGSSLDGVDLACCEFSRGNKLWDYKIVAAETLPYPADLKEKLEQACSHSMDQIRDLDLQLGKFYGNLLNEFHRKYNILPALISSHGHTILHEPHRGITLQAGNGKEIARKTGIRVVNDFRREDVAQGGQGAPLVPVGDRLLFGNYEGCLNLGGFANISYEGIEGERIAFDIGPANMALNWIAGLKGSEFDRDGKMASQGKVSESLIKALNQMNYYSDPAPKSLGREWFLDSFLPLLKQQTLSIEDLMATTAEHIAVQIARGINDAQLKNILVTGGGALNQNLIERLKQHTTAEIHIPDASLIHFKEALVFAFLGLLKMRKEINCLSSVTGGKNDLSVGVIHN
jgi:anhydro-N-acetylmuramic acid kinase